MHMRFRLLVCFSTNTAVKSVFLEENDHDCTLTRTCTQPLRAAQSVIMLDDGQGSVVPEQGIVAGAAVRVHTH